jgi:hypothetical protein
LPRNCFSFFSAEQFVFLPLSRSSSFRGTNTALVINLKSKIENQQSPMVHRLSFIVLTPIRFFPKRISFSPIWHEHHPPGLFTSHVYQIAFYVLQITFYELRFTNSSFLFHPSHFIYRPWSIVNRPLFLMAPMPVLPPGASAVPSAGVAAARNRTPAPGSPAAPPRAHPVESPGGHLWPDPAAGPSGKYPR